MATAKVAKKTAKSASKSVAGKGPKKGVKVTFTRPAELGTSSKPVGCLWEKSKVPSFYVLEVDPISIAAVVKKIKTLTDGE